MSGNAGAGTDVHLHAIKDQVATNANPHFMIVS